MKNKKKVENKQKLVLLTVVFLIIGFLVLGIFFVFNNNGYLKTIDYSKVGGPININLNRKNRELSVDVYRNYSCGGSAFDINGNFETRNYSTILTEEEMIKIENIYKESNYITAHLAGVLESIARDEEHFYSSEFGDITCREKGNHELEFLLKK